MRQVRHLFFARLINRSRRYVAKINSHNKIFNFYRTLFKLIIKLYLKISIFFAKSIDWRWPLLGYIFPAAVLLELKGCQPAVNRQPGYRRGDS